MITYQIQIDLDKDGQFANPAGHIENRVLSASWTLGIPDAFRMISSPMQCNVTVHDPDNNFSLDRADGVFGVSLRDTLVRLLATVGGVAYTLVTGWIVEVLPPEIANGTSTTIIIEDKMLVVQDAEYLPMLSTNILLSDEIQNIFESGIVGYPYNASYWIMDASRLDIDTILFEENIFIKEDSKTTLEWAGDAADRGNGVSALGYIMDLMTAEMGGRFFVNRDGKFVFHNRHRDLLVDIVDTFTDAEYDGIQPITGEVYNEVTVNFLPREVGGAGSVLFAYEGVPFAVQPGKTRKIRGRYRDPNNEDASIGGMDVINPVANTDYIANSQADGNGINRTNTLNLSFEIGGTSTDITIANPSTEIVYVTKLQVRGTPLITYKSQQVTTADAESIHRYGRSALPPIDGRFISDEEIAESYADQLLNNYSLPSTRYLFADFEIGSIDGARDGLAERVLGCEIGTGLTIINAVTGHNLEYVVISERHMVSGQRHRVTIGLRPARRLIVWQLNISALDVDTYLAL